MASTKPIQPIQPTDIPESLLPTSGLELFLEEHFKKILLGVGAVLLGTGLYGIISHRNHVAAVASSEAASQAKNKDDCDLVIKDFPGTVAAGNAMLFKAKLLWDEGKKETAVQVLREFTLLTDHPFYLNGLISLATKLEASNDLKGAKEIYGKIIAENGTSDIAGLAKLRLADALWTEGKEDEAKKQYESFPRDYIGSPFIEQNRERLTWLGSGLPTKEVDGPPAALKAPDAAGGAPQIKLDGGLGGIGANMPFSIGQSAPTAKPTISIEPTPAVNPPTTPGTPPKIEIKPTPAPVTPANAPVGPATSPPVAKPAAQVTSPPAASAPLATPPAPAPAPTTPKP